MPKSYQRSVWRHVARGGILLSLLQSSAACSGGSTSDPAMDDGAEAIGTVASELTTEIFSSTALARGASKTGVYTATAAGEITFRTSGTGDADLFIKKGAPPTRFAYDAKSEGPTSTEQVKIKVSAGEKIYYLIYGYEASTVSLSVVTPDETAAETVELFPTTTISQGASKTGTYTATTAGELTFRTSGTGDADLFIRKGSAPTRSVFDAKSDTLTSTEQVKITVAAGDTIHYLVYGYKTASVKLVVELPGAANYAATLSLPSLSQDAAFQAFSTAGGGLSTSGRSMKFLIDNRNPAARTTNFMNGNYAVNGVIPSYAKYHYDFAKRRYGIGDSNATFNNTTYFTNDKRFFAGNIQTYKLGDAQSLVYAIQFYPDDVISEGSLLQALQTIKAAFTVPNAKLVFVATGPQQTFGTIRTQAAALGIDLMTIDQVLGNIKYVPLNTGEAWGYLRIFPANVETLRPTDIPVFDDLPLDLSVVAGTITKAYQDINSHVNLKAKERNTPNMVLRDAGPTHPALSPFADRPVHLKVTSEGFTIEATTAEVVEQKLAERLAAPWVPLPVVDDTALRSFDEVCSIAGASCFQFAKAYGGKTQGLGFLVGALGRASSPTSVSAPFGYDLSPRGFGIPVKAYRDFVDAPENATLKAKLGALIAAEKAGSLSPVERNALSAEVQTLFYTGRVPGSLVADVTERIGAVMPAVEKFKFRSSATSEDVPNFNGAGLYDSFSIEPDKVDKPDFSCVIETENDGVATKLKIKPKTVQCGIKAVFASLWNPRAIVERTFGRLDHATAGMGITINPAYGDELANLVLVTRVVGTDAIYGYTLSVQKGENLVTNPIPGTITEFNVASFSDFARPPRFSTTRYAKPTPTDPVMTTTILTEQQMVDIVEVAKKIEISYCKSKPAYYPGGNCNEVWLDVNKPLSLDMEIKLLPYGNYQFKQVR